MKAKKKIIIVIIVLILLILGFIALTEFDLYLRLYIGNREKGTVTITVDGKKHELQKDDIRFEGKEIKKKDEGSVKIDGTTAHISLKAKEYGSHDFCIDNIPNCGTIIIKIYHWNWYSVTKFGLDINIDSEKGTLTYEGHYSNLNDFGIYVKHEVSDTVDIQENENIAISLYQ